ncbi:MAG TPA: AAA family ATPase, partial [Candidatus Limnocylindria bacterium]
MRGRGMEAPGRQVAHQETTDDLEALLEALPVEVVDRVRTFANRADLLEIVMDLGRRPEARFTHGEELLLEREVAEPDIAYVIDHIGAFGDDNRAGIERTLHRISAIRNRAGKVVGLTCRIGRAVFGTIDIIRDIVEGGQSVLLLGRPGVGKTTMLREVARVLADDLGKRVIVVDTSNEIAGDGDIPHPGIGDARRMQVRTPTDQHGVMIEAVENHMPEVIVIDEIGTELEAGAARTIAERGVQLVGTAHGNTLDNLMLNPTLSDLIGGIQTVTLGDEEARRRGTQKTVLERKAPPTFDVLVEMQERQRVAVHRDVAETVDAALRSQPVAVEVRSRRDDGSVERRLEVLGRYGAGDGRGGRTPRGGFDEEVGGRGDRYERRDRDDRSDRGDRAERGGRRNGRGGWADRWERTLAAREEYHRRPEFGAYGPRG